MCARMRVCLCMCACVCVSVCTYSFRCEAWSQRGPHSGKQLVGQSAVFWVKEKKKQRSADRMDVTALPGLSHLQRASWFINGASTGYTGGESVEHLVKTVFGFKVEET